MNVKTWIPLGLAILLGAVALVIGRKAVAPRGPAEPTNTVKVVVAARDVAPGKVLSAEDLTSGRVPKEMAPARSFSDPKDVVGRTATFALLKGQAVVETLLAAQGTGGGVQALIPAGLRAITVEVNEFSGLGGMLVPGCRVDVVATVRDEKAQQQASRTILQNIKVLAVGRQFNPNPPPAPDNAPPPPPTNNVTLLVTPRQAQALKLASQGGAPWLVLRNSGDGKEVETDPTLISDLKADRGNGGTGMLGWLQRPTPGEGDPTAGTEPVSTGPGPTTRRATRSVQVIRGGVESEVSVPVSGRGAPRRQLTEWRPDAPPAPTTGPVLVAPNALSSTKE
jgi:pilus assembly protein CpaB